ncbi:MAG: sigma-70 family RNA polymerase sigma factor [Candidatus Caldatribacteriota bacterium]|nr:sigma-70 family RNA polymerase sigma factor [Candidatus Caldatribacteriota bacterium]
MAVVKKMKKITDEQISIYQPLVNSIASRFLNSGEPLEDLQQIGYIGLINALNLYNNDKGVKFETYATWLISGEIRHYIRDKHQVVKIPRWMLNLNKQIDKYIISFKSQKKRFPNIAEISEKFNITEEGLKEVFKSRDAVQLVSLDQERRKGNIDIQPKYGKIKSKNYQTFKLPIEDIIILRTALNKLQVIQKKVIYYLFEMDLTQKSTAKKLGISQRKVSRIKESALKDLKDNL